jgi:hypothetical protein
MVCGKCFHIHFHYGHYLAQVVKEKTVYGLQDCEKNLTQLMSKNQCLLR